MAINLPFILRFDSNCGFNVVHALINARLSSDGRHTSARAQAGKWTQPWVFQTELIEYRELVTWVMEELRNETGGEMTQGLATTLPPDGWRGNRIRCCHQSSEARGYLYIYTHSATREAHVYTHVHKFFFMFFSLLGYYKMLSIVPRLYSMSLLVIYFVYSSVMLIQNF